MNPLAIKKSPSLIKLESQSEAGLNDTPIPLPQDTPMEPPRSASGLMSTPSIMRPTPIQRDHGSLPEMQTLNLYGVQGKQFNGFQAVDQKDFLGTGIGVSDLVKHQTVEGGKTPPDKTPTLQNIVSTADLKCKLDLKTIALNARNTEYNPKRFAAAIMKIRNPKTTALIFSSGKMVCTGAKSEEDSKKAAKKFAKTIKNMGFDVRFTDFKVQNIVASADVHFAIRLESLNHKHADFCQYEPEIFPGLIYRIYQPKVVVLIFVSGKIVLTGAKTIDQIQEAYTNILPALQMHKKDDANVIKSGGK